MVRAGDASRIGGVMVLTGEAPRIVVRWGRAVLPKPGDGPCLDCCCGCAGGCTHGAFLDCCGSDGGDVDINEAWSSVGPHPGGCATTACAVALRFVSAGLLRCPSHSFQLVVGGTDPGGVDSSHKVCCEAGLGLGGGHCRLAGLSAGCAGGC